MSLPNEPDAGTVPDYAGLMRLDEQVHVILGAGYGIGEQSAHALAAFGAKVVCVDINIDRAARVAAAVGGVARSADITQRSDVEALFAAVENDFQRLDGVIDIVGLARVKPVVDFTDDDLVFVDNLVLRHAYLAIKYATQAVGDRSAATDR